MDTTAESDNTERYIFSPALLPEAKEGMSQHPQEYFGKITELERYVDSRITGYRSIWRDKEEIECYGKSPKPHDKIDPFYCFLITVLGNGEKKTFLDGTNTAEFDDYKNKATSTINLFERDSRSLIKSLKKEEKHFCEYYTFFEKLVAEIRDIRKELEEKYVRDYRGTAEQYAEKDTHLKDKEAPVKPIDETMENYFSEWKEFEIESLRGVYDHVTEINAALEKGPCDPLGVPGILDETMYV